MGEPWQRSWVQTERSICTQCLHWRPRSRFSYRDRLLKVNSHLADTPLLHIRTLAIVDKIQIPCETYRGLAGYGSRCYGLSLLRNYRHLALYQNSNFIVLTLNKVDTTNFSYNIFTKILLLIFVKIHLNIYFCINSFSNCTTDLDFFTLACDLFFKTLYERSKTSPSFILLHSQTH